MEYLLLVLPAFLPYAAFAQDEVRPEWLKETEWMQGEWCVAESWQDGEWKAVRHRPEIGGLGGTAGAGFEKLTIRPHDGVALRVTYRYLVFHGNAGFETTLSEEIRPIGANRWSVEKAEAVKNGSTRREAKVSKAEIDGDISENWVLGQVGNVPKLELKRIADDKIEATTTLSFLKGGDLTYRARLVRRDVWEALHKKMP